LFNLEIKIGRGTIRRILKDHLIEPAPARDRRIPWSVFLKTHWKSLAASDFFSVEVWSWKGLTTQYILFVIELATRRVSLCGITTNPNEAWMLQVARNLMDSESGALLGKRHLIVDRDTKYSAAFRAFLAREGVDVIRLPPRSPNLQVGGRPYHFRITPATKYRRNRVESPSAPVRPVSSLARGILEIVL
jgi:putative transposase